jgi:hypothetical protein
MLRKEELLEILNEWNYWERDVEEGLFPREAYMEKMLSYLKTKEVVVLRGVRRSGKSTLLKLLISELQKTHSSKQILLVNFEEPRFYPHLGLELLESIFDAYRTFVNPKEKCFVLLDEIQHIKAWERWVRKYRDLDPNNVKIIVTGSSSRLLDSEYATTLTGRTLPITVFPLSFREYLQCHGVETKGLASPARRRGITALLAKYIRGGGFPETLVTKQKGLLQEYFDGIIYKDIIDRHAIRDSATVKRMAHYLLTNVSKEYSYNSIRKMFGVSLDLVRQYMSYIEATYLVFSVGLFSYSLKEQSVNPRKVYCVDTGLRNIVGFKFSEDWSRLYENVVFLELKNRLSGSNQEVYYWRSKSGREVDFLVRKGMKTMQAMQVCWDVDDQKTRQREVQGLAEALKEFKLTNGVVITEDFEGSEKVGGKNIAYVPLWKWLLER